MAKGKNELDVRAVTPVFRLSHPDLFKARAFGDQDPKYSITMLFPKDKKIVCTVPPTPTTEAHPITLEQLIQNAKISEFGSLENVPKKLHSPIRDGDAPEFHEEGEKEGYKGQYVIKATSRQDNKPTIVDSQMNPITEASVIYPGCYCKAYVYARVWEHKETGRKGVQFILDHIQKVKEGKPFGGKKSVEQVFSPISEDESGEDQEMDFS